MSSKSKLQETIRRGSKRLKIQANRSSELIWNLTLFDGRKKVDTFQAKHMPFLDCSAVRRWLADNNASSLCTAAEKTIASMNNQIGCFH